VTTAQARLAAAGFEGYVAGQTDSTLPAGTVAYTEPSGSAFPGSRVGLYVSTGRAAYRAPFVAPAPRAAPQTKVVPPPARTTTRTPTATTPHPKTTFIVKKKGKKKRG
jgi:hypothetical protein